MKREEKEEEEEKDESRKRVYPWSKKSTCPPVKNRKTDGEGGGEGGGKGGGTGGECQSTSANEKEKEKEKWETYYMMGEDIRDKRRRKLAIRRAMAADYQVEELMKKEFF